MTTDVYFTRTRVMALHSRQNIITNLTVTAAHAPQHHDLSRVARQTLIFIKSLFTLCSRLYDRLYNRLDERFEYSYDEYINGVRVECCRFATDLILLTTRLRSHPVAAVPSRKILLFCVRMNIQEACKIILMFFSRWGNNGRRL